MTPINIELNYTALQSAVLADNLADPATQLPTLVQAKLIDNYTQQSLVKARFAAKELPSDGSVQIPQSDDDLLTWYFAQEGYQPAAVRERLQRKQRVTAELAGLNQLVLGQQARRKQLTNADSAMWNSITSTIAGLQAQIDILTAEKAELDQAGA